MLWLIGNIKELTHHAKIFSLFLDRPSPLLQYYYPSNPILTKTLNEWTHAQRDDSDLLHNVDPTQHFMHDDFSLYRDPDFPSRIIVPSHLRETLVRQLHIRRPASSVCLLGHRLLSLPLLLAHNDLGHPTMGRRLSYLRKRERKTSISPRTLSRSHRHQTPHTIQHGFSRTGTCRHGRNRSPRNHRQFYQNCNGPPTPRPSSPHARSCPPERIAFPSRRPRNSTLGRCPRIPLRPPHRHPRRRRYLSHNDARP